MRSANGIRRALYLLLLAGALAVSAGCVMDGGYGYYDYDYPTYGHYDGGPVGGYYYEGGPVGGYYDGGFGGPYEYRGWGSGYEVGPYYRRRGFDRFDDGGRRGFVRGGGRMHSYRSAPASRPMPSLPSRGGSRRR